jgi:outer membrane protein OmpA-like peptidoglycan-associated protein
MKINFISIVLILAFAAGCASDDPNKHAKQSAGIGAGVGAVLGAVAGNQSGHGKEGALIGAALGGGIGVGIGHRMDQQQKELNQIAETKRTEQGLITKLKSDILFDTGKAELRSSAKNNISELGSIMKKYPENVLTVRGYTDSTGSDKINRPLSEKRAAAVRDQLINSGVPASTISVVGMGSDNPVDTGRAPAALAKNRRVEIEVTVDESKVPASVRK